MSNIGAFLRQLRGKRSLREVERISGVSHTYISSLEKGVDPRSGNPITPTPDTLKKLSEAYNHSYTDLLSRAGYIDGNEDTIQELASLFNFWFSTIIDHNGFLYEGIEEELLMLFHEYNFYQDSEYYFGVDLFPDRITDNDIANSREFVKKFIEICKKHINPGDHSKLDPSTANTDVIELLDLLQPQVSLTYNRKPLGEDDKDLILGILKRIFNKND